MGSFREDARDWLERNCPASIRTPTPANEYVGGGLETDAHLILQEELRRINARPPLQGMGISMIGPALLEFGTEEQKREHLPKIVRGEIWWCQGYSEPNAGSDLASLQTRAVEDGDEYVINGSKIWTSGTDQADWIFCLVRTDPAASKHEGITFILFDIDQPGVTVKPILLISGASPFCETFFDDARASKRNVVGTVNQGWTVAKRLLQYERTSIGGIGRGTQQIESLEDTARRYLGACDGAIADAPLRSAVIDHCMNDRAYALTMRRSLEESQTGKAPGAASSMFKYLDRPGLCRRRVGHDPSVAAFEGQFDRRRHLRGAAQHSRQACSGAAGLTNALLGTLGSSMGLVEHRVASVT